MAGVKTCTRCKEAKVFPSDFYPTKGHTRKSDGVWIKPSHTPHCRRCHIKITNAWRTKHPERIKVHARKRRYGLTESAYIALLTEQGGVCSGCGDPSPTDVDHDHKTGKVRGVLCHNCNRALGNAKDNVEVLDALAAYLVRSR